MNSDATTVTVQGGTLADGSEHWTVMQGGHTIGQFGSESKARDYARGAIERNGARMVVYKDGEGQPIYTFDGEKGWNPTEQNRWNVVHERMTEPGRQRAIEAIERRLGTLENQAARDVRRPADTLDCAARDIAELRERVVHAEMLARDADVQGTLALGMKNRTEDVIAKVAALEQKIASVLTPTVLARLAANEAAVDEPEKNAKENHNWYACGFQETKHDIRKIEELVRGATLPAPRREYELPDGTRLRQLASGETVKDGVVYASAHPHSCSECHAAPGNCDYRLNDKTQHRKVCAPCARHLVSKGPLGPRRLRVRDAITAPVRAVVATWKRAPFPVKVGVAVGLGAALGHLAFATSPFWLPHALEAMGR